MKDNYTWYEKIILKIIPYLVIGFICYLLIYIFSFYYHNDLIHHLPSNFYYEDSKESFRVKTLTPNEIGDAFGGSLAPIIGLLGVILTYLAFYIQYKANKDQLEIFNKNQIDQIESSNKQFFIKLIDNLHSKLLNISLNETHYGGGIGSTFSSSESTISSFKAIDKIVNGITADFYKYSVNLGQHIFAKYNDKMSEIVFENVSNLLYIADASTHSITPIELQEKLKTIRHTMDIKQFIARNLSTIMPGSNEQINNVFKDIALTYFEESEFHERVELYQKISSNIFSISGSFIDSYLKCLNLIVDELLKSNDKISFYKDYFENGVTYNERIILYYILISNQFPNNLKQKLLKIDFFNEDFFACGHKTFFEYEFHKKELENIISFKEFSD